jgi:hypothetical protein
MKGFLSVFIVVLVLLLGTICAVSADDAVVKLSGITITDEHPNGCVDCHVNAGGGNDYRLNVELKALKGHPDVTKMVRNVPQDCAMCHKPNVPAGALNTQTHRLHYQNPDENHFVTGYQGECLACHSLNINTGIMTVKSGPKNW